MTIRPVQRSRNSPISYLLTNKDETKYRVLEKDDVEKALHRNRVYISELRRVEIHLTNLTCTAVGCVIPKDGIEISQIDMHTFTFILSDPTEGAVNCRNVSASLASVKLPKSGFVTLPESCSLTTKMFKIHKFSDNGASFLQRKEPSFQVQDFSIHTQDEMTDEIMNELEKTEDSLRESLEDLANDSQIQIAKQLKLIKEAKDSLKRATVAGGISLLVVASILIASIIAIFVLKETISRYHN